MEPSHEEVETIKRVLIQNWIQHLLNWFPHLGTKTYFVPPIHVNTLCVKEIDYPPASKRLKATEDTAYELCDVDSNFRDDRAQFLVANSLWKLELRNVVMVVLTRYEVSHYMDKALTGTPNISVFFPVPKTCDDRTLRRGKFDVLIIHKQLGFIVIEVQAIGDATTSTRDDLTIVPKKLDRGLFKLSKLEKILKYITSDMKVDIPITKTFALPNLARERLKQIVNETSDVRFRESIQDCLRVQSTEDLVELCICRDDIQDPHISHDVTSINDWWERIEAHISVNQNVDDSVYGELIARFCGPLSTVAVWNPGRKKRPGNTIEEVRSVKDAIERMGSLYTMRILRREQLDVINYEDKLLFLTGPPGAGKTLILLTKAVRWISKGDTVILVRGPGNNPGHFISHVLYQHILKTLRFYELPEGNVHMKTIDAFMDPAHVVCSFMTKYKEPGKHVRLLIDEMWAVNLVGKMKPLIPDVQESLEAASVELDTVLESCQAKNLPQHTSETYSALQDILGEIKNTLYDTQETLTRMNVVNEVAMSLLVDEVPEMLSILERGINKLLKKIKMLETYGLPDMTADHKHLERILEIIQDTRFCTRVILSWLASHVLLEITQVVGRQPHGISLWCTGFWPDRCPNGYKLAVLQHSVRCPPHVQAILAKTENLASHRNRLQYKYIRTSTDIQPPLPAEGKIFQEINHWNHVPSGGPVTEISDCMTCGAELAGLLLNKLKIGQDEKLHYRDVIIVSRPLLPLKENSAFIRTLKSRGIPIFIMIEKSEDIGEIDADKVVVTNTYNGHGLERPVVVFVPVASKCDPSGAEEPMECSNCAPAIDSEFDLRWMKSMGSYNQRGLFFVASRSVADIIIIKVEK